MSEDVDELVRKSGDLRKAGRLDEAILSARRATGLFPDNANTWWQLALGVEERDRGAAAIPHYKKTVELAETFAYGWYRLGNALDDTGNSDEAIAAWENACIWDDELPSARHRLVDAYLNRGTKEDREKRHSHLITLKERGELRSIDYFNLAVSYHNRGDYRLAIVEYRQYLSHTDSRIAYSNLGLAYQSDEIWQHLDAADCYLMALALEPGHNGSKEGLSASISILEKQNDKISKFIGLSNSLLPGSQQYQHYVNPFELLELDSETDQDIKEIQKKKKQLLQEIELESGSVSWMPGLSIDRSRAIKVSDELNDKSLYEYSRIVFKDQALSRFLSIGTFELFSYSEKDFPKEVISTIEIDEAFHQWLSGIYAKQFDSVFAVALSNRDLTAIEALLSGRRFVTAEDEDRCFSSGLRISEEFLSDLERFAEESKAKKPSLLKLKLVLHDNSLDKLLELLPPAFRELQSKAANIIRSISVTAYNEHNDAELARAILNLASGFAKKSPSFKDKLQEDMNTLEELINKEREDEVELNFGERKLKITKKGISYGDESIQAERVETLRWGVTVTNSAGIKEYAFRIAVGSSGSNVIQIYWKAIKELEKQETYFQNCVNAIATYILPTVIEKVTTEIVSGRSVSIGGIAIRRQGLKLPIKGWFSTKEELFHWQTLRSEIKNGDVVVTTSMNSKAQVAMPISEIDNAWILHILISQGTLK